MITYLPARFTIHRDLERCIGCQACVSQCSFGAHAYDELDGEIRSHDERCVDCHRCVVFCPTRALTITRNPLDYRENYNWRPEVIEDITRQADSGGILLTGMGTDKGHRIYGDHLVLNASPVTNPSIDPLREPMELRTYLGRKPDQVDIDPASLSLRTPLAPRVAIEMPLLFSAISYGAVNLNVHESLARAAAEAGILFNIGESGLHRSLYRFGDNTIVQVASGRFGVHREYLDVARAIEIKIGQGPSRASAGRPRTSWPSTWLAASWWCWA